MPTVKTTNDSKVEKTCKTGTNRLLNGRFAPNNSGNPKGRPPIPEIEELRKALHAAQKKFDKSFLEHFVERAFENDQVAIALAKKIIPDKIANEGEVLKVVNLIYAYRNSNPNSPLRTNR